LAEDAGLISNKSGQLDLISTVETVHGQYSEMAVLSPDGLSICRFIIDPYTEKLYSTQATEVARIQQLMSQGMALTDALQRLVDESVSR
jgi:conjugal transfer ATP-binding protein TraC